MLQINQQCPICQKTFKKSDFSLHLQFCLDRSERSNLVSVNNDSVNMRTNSVNVINDNTVSSSNLLNNDNSTNSDRLLSRVNDTPIVNNNNKEQRKTITIIKNNNKTKNKNKNNKISTLKNKISYEINDDLDDFQNCENKNNKNDRKRTLESMRNDRVTNEENKENNEGDNYDDGDDNNYNNKNNNRNNWSCKEYSEVYGKNVLHDKNNLSAKNVLHDSNNVNGNEERNNSWIVNQNVNNESHLCHNNSIDIGDRYSDNNNNYNNNRYDNNNDDNSNYNIHHIHINNSNSKDNNIYNNNNNNTNKYFNNSDNNHINNQEISGRKLGECSFDNTKEHSSVTISNTKISESQIRGYTSHTIDRSNNGNLLYNGNCVSENIQNKNIVLSGGRNSEFLGQHSRLILKKDQQFTDEILEISNLAYVLQSSENFMKNQKQCKFQDFNSYQKERFYRQKKSFNYSNEFLKNLDNEKEIQKFKNFGRFHFFYEKKKRNLDNLARKNIENVFVLKLNDCEDDGRKNGTVRNSLLGIMTEKIDEDENENENKNKNFDKSYHDANHNNDDNYDYDYEVDNDNHDNNIDDNRFSNDINHKISRNTFKIKTNLTDWKIDLISELNDFKNINKVLNEIQSHTTKNKRKNIVDIKSGNDYEKRKIIEYEYENKNDNNNKNNVENESRHLFSENDFLLNIAFNYETIAFLSASFLNLKNDEHNDKKNKKNEEKEKTTKFLCMMNNIDNQNIDDYVTECHINNNEIASDYEKSNISNDDVLRNNDKPFLTDLTEYGNGLIDENNDYNNDNDDDNYYNNDNNNNYNNDNSNNVILNDNGSDSVMIINNDSDLNNNNNDNNNSTINNNNNNSNNINHNNNVDNNNNRNNNINKINNKTQDIRVEMYEHLCAYGIAVVVKNEGSAVRDAINMDDSNVIGRLNFKQIVCFDDIQIEPGIPNETVDVKRLHVYIPSLFTTSYSTFDSTSFDRKEESEFFSSFWKINNDFDENEFDNIINLNNNNNFNNNNKNNTSNNDKYKSMLFSLSGWASLTGRVIDDCRPILKILKMPTLKFLTRDSKIILSNLEISNINDNDNNNNHININNNVINNNNNSNSCRYNNNNNNSSSNNSNNHWQRNNNNDSNNHNDTNYCDNKSNNNNNNNDNTNNNNSYHNVRNHHDNNNYNNRIDNNNNDKNKNGKNNPQQPYSQTHGNVQINQNLNYLPSNISDLPSNLENVNFNQLKKRLLNCPICDIKFPIEFNISDIDAHLSICLY